MIWRKLKLLWPPQRRAQEREMREELESLAGMATRGELGNLTLAAENARQTWSWTWLDGIFADFRYAFRALRNQPGFVAVAVISLALGIGANSAVFSFADALLLRPLPVSSPSEVLTVSNATPGNPGEGMSYPDYLDLREKNHSFAGLVAYRLIPLGASSTTSEPPQMRLGILVSDNYFGALGVAPAYGRTFLPEEANANGNPVAIFAYDYWKNQYQSDASVVGRSLRLNGVAFTIIGVAPVSFTGLDRFVRPSIYVPLSTWRRLDGGADDPLENRARHELTVKGRLHPDASRESAQAELSTLAQNLEAAYPKTNHNRRAAVRTEMETRILQTPRQVGLITTMMGLVGLVLIIACSNVASLLLARARARSREIAVRLAIGASRLRLVRQLMTESLIVALLGGAVGVLVAYGGIAFLGTLNVPSDIPFVLGVQLDTRVMLFSLLAALASCLFFGLAPAFQTVRADLVPALKSGGEAISTRRRLLGRNALVVGQIAFAMVLLVATGMFLDAFRKMLTIQPSFRTDHLISMEVNPSVRHYSPEHTYDFYRSLADRTRSLAGVRSVAMAESIPLSPTQTTLAVVPEGYQFPKGQEKVTVFGGVFDDSYFNTMNVEILRGRAFTASDRMGTPLVAIVNDQFAKTYWPNQNAIGKLLRLERADSPAAEVVGVAKTGPYLIVNESPAPYVYLPYEQRRRTRMTLIVQSHGDPSALATPLRNVVHKLDANLPIYNLRTVASLYENRATGTWLTYLQMIAAMGFIGLILATAGLYGLISYSVSRRTAEIGVRIAIGASRTDVLRLVLRQGIILATAGIAIGGILVAALTPAVAANFLGVGTFNLSNYVMVPAILLAISAAASYLPARRAARLDPIRALRCE